MYPLFFTNSTAATIFTGTTIAWVALEMLRWFGRRPAPGQRKQDRLSGPILMASLWAGAYGAVMVAQAAPALAVAGNQELLFGLGIGLMLAGIAFRWYAIRVLGKSFAPVVTVSQDQAIVETGPYRLIRHPSYTGALVTLLGYGLACTNWLSLAVALIVPGLGYAYRIVVEERALMDALGEGYRQYMKRTKRIIPFVI